MTWATAFNKYLDSAVERLLSTSAAHSAMTHGYTANRVDLQRLTVTASCNAQGHALSLALSPTSPLRREAIVLC